MTPQLAIFLSAIVPEAHMLGTILLVLAFVLFLLGAFSVPAPPRVNFVAAGLACWVLSILLGHLPLS